MLFYFVSCISMVHTWLREEKCSQKRRKLNNLEVENSVLFRGLTKNCGLG